VPDPFAFDSAPAFQGLKIFGVSGHAQEQFDLPSGGVDGWFRKPFDQETLLRELDRELGTKA